MNTTQEQINMFILQEFGEQFIAKEVLKRHLLYFMITCLIVVMIKLTFDIMSLSLTALYNMMFSSSQTVEETDNTENNIITTIHDDYKNVMKFNEVFEVEQIWFDETSNEEANRIINNGFALIEEEFKELEDAIKDNNFIEVKDALCDLVYVTFGLMHRIQYSFICDDNLNALKKISSFVDKLKSIECSNFTVNERIQASTDNSVFLKNLIINSNTSYYKMLKSSFDELKICISTCENDDYSLSMNCDFIGNMLVKLIVLFISNL